MAEHKGWCWQDETNSSKLMKQLYYKPTQPSAPTDAAKSCPNKLSGVVGCFINPKLVQHATEPGTNLCSYYQTLLTHPQTAWIHSMPICISLNSQAVSVSLQVWDTVKDLKAKTYESDPCSFLRWKVVDSCKHSDLRNQHSKKGIVSSFFKYATNWLTMKKHILNASFLVNSCLASSLLFLN